MPTLPVREVGRFGAVPDLNPYDTPANVVTESRNVRFVNGNIRSFPLFKELQDEPRFTSNPVLVFQRVGVDGVRKPNLVLEDGRIIEFTGDAQVEVQGTSWGAADKQATVTHLGGSTFLTHRARRPVWRDINDTEYSFLPNWVSTEVCNSMRSFKDFLVAINVTKGADDYPNMVKTSNSNQVGQAPFWDPTEVGTLASENILADHLGELVDGCELGGSFFIYGTNAVYRMDYIGLPLVFSYTKVIDSRGIMGLNCVASVNLKHFVFDQDDIYVHDGLTPQSICDKRTRKTIFSRLSTAHRDRCFVYHNSTDSEIMFCYPSKGTAGILLEDTEGCNEAAVYNYLEDTWTFVDLPGVQSICDASIPYIQSWGTPLTWEEAKNNWLSFGGDPIEVPLMAAAQTNASTSSALLFLDQQVGGFLSNAVCADHQYDGFYEFALKDFSEIGAAINHHKTIRAIYPFVKVAEPQDYIEVQVGSTTNMSSGVEYQPVQQFYPFMGIKVDCKIGAPFLTLRWVTKHSLWAEMSEFHLDVLVLSMR